MRGELDKDKDPGSFKYLSWMEKIGESQLVRMDDDTIPIHRLLQIKKVSVTKRTVIVDIED